MPPEGTATAQAAAARRLTWPASLAVLVGAADTYVVVLALPAIATAVGLDGDELQRAAPIVTVFLLGYVCALPLLGRLSDVVGRRRVLVGCLAVFALGSLLTAAAPDLGTVLAGRFLQGAGGGGLVPVTLALVADGWSTERRGTPLGVVGAAQEVGALLGPLAGAVVLAAGDWRAVFWLNLGIGVALALACAGGRGAGTVLGRVRADVPGAALLAVCSVVAVVAVLRPHALVESVSVGRLFQPFGTSWWTSPAALAAVVLLLAAAVRERSARHPLVDTRAVVRVLGRVDPVGAVLLTVALGGVVLTFAVADPAVELVADAAPVLLGVAAVAAVAFAVRQRRAAAPLLPRGTLRARPARGALVVSVLVGAALVAVLVSVPVFVRTTVPDTDQLDAALVLVRFLVAVPLGALLGGLLVRYVPASVVAGGGLAAVAVSTAAVAAWDADALLGRAGGLTVGGGPTLGLLGAGLGFGLALAPVNAALLASTAAPAHGIASALVVVARTVGMLVGLSALTAVGLRRYTEARTAAPNPLEVCPDNPLECPVVTDALRAAAVTQTSTILAGGAVCAGVAAALALLLLGRGHATRATL